MQFTKLALATIFSALVAAAPMADPSDSVLNARQDCTKGYKGYEGYCKRNTRRIRSPPVAEAAVEEVAVEESATEKA